MKCMTIPYDKRLSPLCLQMLQPTRLQNVGESFMQLFWFLPCLVDYATQTLFVCIQDYHNVCTVTIVPHSVVSTSGLSALHDGQI